MPVGYLGSFMTELPRTQAKGQLSLELRKMGKNYLPASHP